MQIHFFVAAAFFRSGETKRGQEKIIDKLAARGRYAIVPRQVRIEFPGATYHVMCRGDRRGEIFRGDRDREMTLATVEKTGWQVHAWVWMSNHYHLLVETPEMNLVKGMTWFQTTYTTRFNARHRLRGHLFGGRYKAVLVDRGEPRCFSTLLDYIHLNPVRAGIIKARLGGDLRDYRWSSWGGYVPTVKQKRGRCSRQVLPAPGSKQVTCRSCERPTRER